MMDENHRYDEKTFKLIESFLIMTNVGFKGECCNDIH
jgi:hypothetical protein